MTTTSSMETFAYEFFNVLMEELDQWGALPLYGIDGCNTGPITQEDVEFTHAGFDFDEVHRKLAGVLADKILEHGSETVRLIDMKDELQKRNSDAAIAISDPDRGAMFIQRNGHTIRASVRFTKA